MSKKNPVANIDASVEDDEEANEDLSLKILEKALSRRRDSKETTSMSDLCGSGVISTVMVNGGKLKTSKKTKRTNAHEISFLPKDQEDENKLEEDVLKGEEDDHELKPGETSSNMVLKKLLRGARYFDPPDDAVACYSCGEHGHVTVNCPTPTRRRKPCFICGSLEHGAKQCTKGHDCYICKKGGHRAKDCPDKYKSGSKTAVCLRCGDFGHDMILCKYDYSHDDLKDIQCYVCKHFGHLCCVVPGNSPSWAVSCYRCGQLGHTGLACGRFSEESTEKESASSCFRCGEEGHFSRECPNSSSISTSNGRDSLSLCYRCNGVGHFARDCPSSSQVSKRKREISTPSHNSAPHESNGKMKKKKKNKENSEHYSTPHESKGKMKNKKKTHKGQQPHSTPQKPKHRGGWITEEDYSQRGKIRKPRSPVTPSGHNQHRSPITPSGHNHHRSPITPSGHNHHRSPITPSGHNHRSLTFHSGGNFPGSQSTTPYYRNRRNSPFESSGYLSSHPPSRWQSYYPPSRHHQHHQDHRDAPAPLRYGSAHHHDEFQRNYGRW